MRCLYFSESAAVATIQLSLAVDSSDRVCCTGEPEPMTALAFVVLGRVVLEISTMLPRELSKSASLMLSYRFHNIKVNIPYQLMLSWWMFSLPWDYSEPLWSWLRVISVFQNSFKLLFRSGFFVARGYVNLTSVNSNGPFSAPLFQLPCASYVTTGLDAVSFAVVGAPVHCVSDEQLS